MNNQEIKSTAYGRGLGLAACAAYSQQEVDIIVAEAVAAERERCAKLCEGYQDPYEGAAMAEIIRGPNNDHQPP